MRLTKAIAFSFQMKVALLQQIESGLLYTDFNIPKPNLGTMQCENLLERNKLLGPDMVTGVQVTQDEIAAILTEDDTENRRFLSREIKQIWLPTSLF